MIATVCTAAVVVIIPLIAAAWLIPPDFPHLLRQVLLCMWGVGAILIAERWLFSHTLRQAALTIGFAGARMDTLAAAALASLPMWVFLPAFLWTRGEAVNLRPEWLQSLIGVVLVNGIAEEVIHRGFVFGHVRRARTFARAAIISAAIFAAQHLYLVAIIGNAGWASVLLAALLAFPLAFVYERGGNSIGGPAILHTSSNAPALILELRQDTLTAVLVPHMTVVLLSMYSVMYLTRNLRAR